VVVVVVEVALVLVYGVVRRCASFPRDARSLSVSRFLVIVGVDDMWGDACEEAGGGRSRSMSDRRTRGKGRWCRKKSIGVVKMEG